MRNIKFISVFAAIGFILSFVFGFFSHSSFITILLKALLFGAIFVGLGFLISFIFNKFLVDSDSLDLGGEDNGEMSSNSDSSNYAGQNIDIVVEDEALPQSDSDNHFIVGDNHQMLKSTDIKEDSINNDFEGEGTTNNTFVPLRKTETSKNFSGVESKTPEETANLSDVEDLNSADENLDTLPDMENLSVMSESGSRGEEDDSYSDSGFVSSTNTFKKNDSPAPEMKDASLYAQAISTILSGDDAL